MEAPENLWWFDTNCGYEVVVAEPRGGDGPPYAKYTRSDLYTAAQERIKKLEAQVQKYRVFIDEYCELSRDAK